MRTIWGFMLYSLSLGVGLAADAFSVSVVNGIRHPGMRASRALLIAGTFALFQALMPVLGWCLTNTLMDFFQPLHRLLPRVSQFFLLYLGIRMLLEGGGSGAEDVQSVPLTTGGLLFQGVVTSVDALLIGFTLADWPLLPALACFLIIALVTLVLCFLGVRWGRALGLKLAGRASVLSGLILILIAAWNVFRFRL